MKSFFSMWNKESIDNKVIIENIKELSNNKLSIDIEKVSAFNLTSNKFNVTREADAVFELKKQYDADPSQPNTLKTLAKLNGFVDEKGNPDVGALLNVYIPILQDREKN